MEANISTALAHRHITTNKLHMTRPDEVHVITGYFDRTCLNTTFPTFTQYVICSTWGNNILDSMHSLAILLGTPVPLLVHTKS